jgi:hypothetical protein
VTTRELSPMQRIIGPASRLCTSSTTITSFVSSLRIKIKMCKVGMESNTADPLTKPLSLAKYERHVGAMGIRYMRD